MFPTYKISHTQTITGLFFYLNKEKIYICNWEEGSMQTYIEIDENL